MGDRLHGRGVLAGLALALALAGCAKDDPGAAEATSSTTTVPSLACSGASADPVPLVGTAADPSFTDQVVVDVVARPTGEVVAIGTSVWIRDPGAAEWRSAPPPGGPNDTATAAAASGEEVWVATDDDATPDRASRLFRSSDLETWEEVPFTLDGATTPAAVYALVRDGDGWLALAQDAESIHLITSPDAQAWTTRASLAVEGEADTAKALFDLATLDSGPASVGFTIGGAAPQPLVTVWAADGPVTDQPHGDDLAGVRLWALTPLADGRTLVAADRVALTATNEPTGFTPFLYERSSTGALSALAPLPTPVPFAVPVDMVEVGGGEIVVVGSVGSSRTTVVPAAWSVCLPHEP